MTKKTEATTLRQCSLFLVGENQREFGYKSTCPNCGSHLRFINKVPSKNVPKHALVIHFIPEGSDCFAGSEDSDHKQNLFTSGPIY